MPLTVAAVDSSELNVLLAKAAAEESNSYINARNAILSHDKELPLLLVAATNPALSWQQHLVARICVEHIVRSNEIESLRNYNWRNDPKYNHEWEGSHVGPSSMMGGIAVPKFVEMGLSYYYIEVLWKNTEERSAIRLDKRQRGNWAGWCAAAVDRAPESYYLAMINLERLTDDPTIQNMRSFGSWHYLVENRISLAVPLLIRSYDAYFNIVVTGPEAFPGRHAELYAGMFQPVLAFADMRHADLLEKFISEKPALAPLKDAIGEVRKRRAAPLPEEPSFRLGIAAP